MNLNNIAVGQKKSSYGARRGCDYKEVWINIAEVSPPRKKIVCLNYDLWTGIYDLAV